MVQTERTVEARGAALPGLLSLMSFLGAPLLRQGPRSSCLQACHESSYSRLCVLVPLLQAPVAVPVSVGVPLSMAQAWQLEQQLHGGHMYGSPMQMCYVQQSMMADRQGLQAAAAAPAPPPEPQQSNNSTLFFCGATPVVTVEALLTVFAQFGRVLDLNLFRPYRGCRTSKVGAGQGSTHPFSTCFQCWLLQEPPLVLTLH